MNSAFRAWRKINVYPDYYIAVDETVTKSIADEINSLATDGTIKKFLLHDSYLEIYPQAAQNANITFLSNTLTSQDKFFNPEAPVTTGAWAIRWMASQGFDKIAVIGLDGIRQEIISSASHTQPGTIELSINKTPSFNPNYFFSDYQREGDKYRVPNIPAHTRNHGIRLHDHALLSASEELKAEGIAIVDLSVDNLNYVNNRGSIYEFTRNFSTRKREKSHKIISTSDDFKSALLERYAHLLKSEDFTSINSNFFIGSPCESIKCKQETISNSLLRKSSRNLVVASTVSIDSNRINTYSSQDLEFLLYNSTRDCSLLEWEVYDSEHKSFYDFIESLNLSAEAKKKILIYPYQIFANYSDGSANLVSSLKLASKDLLISLADNLFLASSDQALLKQTSSIATTIHRNDITSEIKRMAFRHEIQDATRIDIQINHRFISATSVSATIFLRAASDIAVQLRLTRDGSKTPYECGETVKLSLKKNKLYDVKVNALFLHRHKGSRIEIKPLSSADNLSMLDIKAVSISPSNSRGSFTKHWLLPPSTQFHPKTLPNALGVSAKTSSINLISIDPDLKDMQGHFYRYNSNIFELADSLDISFAILGRKDTDFRSLGRLQECRFHAAFTRNSWQIATNMKVFSREINDISSLALPGKKNIAYMYTGSIFHALCMNTFMIKSPLDIEFVCNLFWEMIKDTSSPEYSQALSALTELHESNKLLVKLTSPTTQVRDFILDKTGIHTSIAPHPSTGFSDSSAVQIIRDKIHYENASIDNSVKKKIIFPGVNTIHKGYDYGVSLALKLANLGFDVAIRPNQDAPRFGKLRYLELALDNQDFEAELASADLIVIPYMPSGFTARTSGLVTDALYFGVPAVVIEDTWLEEFVKCYNSGFSISLDEDSAVNKIVDFFNSISDSPESSSMIMARTDYFKHNSWTNLLASISALGTSTTKASLPEFKKQLDYHIASLITEKNYDYAYFYCCLLFHQFPCDLTRSLLDQSCSSMFLSK